MKTVKIGTEEADANHDGPGAPILNSWMRMNDWSSDSKAGNNPKIIRSVLSDVMNLEFSHLLIGPETQTKMRLDDVEWDDKVGT